MIFSSPVFLFGFFPLVLGINYLIGEKYRNTFLLIASILFYAFAQPEYVFLLAADIVVDYTAGILIERNRAGKTGKFVLWGAVLFNLGILFYFKYFNFVLSSLYAVLQREYLLRDIVLPIGISFFTFKGISYVADVFSGKQKAERNIIAVALYISLFPQILSGPIERFGTIEKELKQRTITAENFAYGTERFIIGLFKKAVLANTLGSLVDEIWQGGAGSAFSAVAWIGSIAYTLQIYYDFSGYSDMAIGTGEMLGFHFNENFRQPYVSCSMTEFWRRWHISLSSWFRDYLYIPLGGNRRHLYRNLIIVFIATGIWHGAAWNFIVWGVFHGFFILMERIFRHKNDHKHEQQSLFKSVLAHIYCMFVVNLGWVLFRAPDLSAAVQYMQSMFGLTGGETNGLSLFWYLNRWNSAVLMIGLLMASGLPYAISGAIKSKLSDLAYTAVKYSSLLLLMFFSILRVVTDTYTTFIYFQF